MSEQQSRRTEIEEISRIDSLLKVLGDLSNHEPSSALRERISVLASERLSQNPRRVGRNAQKWLEPALAIACLLVIGLAVEFALHFSARKPADNLGIARVGPPAVSPETRVHSAPHVRPSIEKPPKVHHSRIAPLKPTSGRQMTMRLPYSNSAIETGTDTTIRVSMSQSDLLSLGFPINTTVQDRRIVAELTLGGDGLPLAISIPLPLEVMKEKR